MIRSMTGYGKVLLEHAGFSISITIKSTNHRHLDLQVRLPAGMESLDPVLRRIVKAQVGRGHVEVAVGWEHPGVAELRINHDLVQAYAKACQNLRKEYGFTADLDPVALLRIPGVVTTGNDGLLPAELAEVQRVLEQATAEGLAKFDEMRVREGEVLDLDLRSRLARLHELSNAISRLSERIAPLYQKRLEERLHEMLGNVTLDPARLAQEVAYMVSRSDIAEELTRLESHLDQCWHLLDEGGEAGKKLDFLLQELNREANTLLSKTTDVPEIGAEIGRQAIEMKSEIEKLREQVQNIE